MGSRFSALSLATFKIIFQQDEITLQLKLLDMYNELLQNPAFSNSEVPLTFPQFVALTQSLTYQANQVSIPDYSEIG